MRNRNCALFLLNLLVAFALIACTDYEELLEDDYGYLLIGTEEDWEEESSSSVIASSSSFLRHSESSTECDEEPSSSSDVIASSSSAKQSSSSIVYGTLRDSRDGQTYKTVTIGDQVWMAQNLNYAPDENHVHSLGDYAWSGCYGGKADSCAKHGRLYTWEVAMDKAGCGYGESCNNSYEGSQGICPEGWHLPSKAEWDTLFTNVGGEEVAGRMLKSEEGWYYHSESTEGIDYYGFSALPAGGRDGSGYFYSAGSYAYFWSFSELDSYYVYSMCLNYYYEDADLSLNNKYNAFSVRCLKDSNGDATSSSSETESSSSTMSSSSLIEESESSSSSVIASSSAKQSSSSIVYGTLTDTRDGQSYKTVTIGTQTWMAQNLNYNYNEGTAKSYCYDDDSDNCDTYGRLYLWSAAMDAAGVFSISGKGCGIGYTCSASGTVQGICPDGWHLPSSSEWQTLFTYIGGTDNAGTILKSNTGWNSGGNGVDDYGFAVLPAGYGVDNGGFNHVGKSARFWSSSEYMSNFAYSATFGYSDLYVYADYTSMSGAFSVRCLRDDASSSSSAMSSSATTEDPESSSSIADAVCYGEYGAEYTCVTTKYLNQDMLDTNGYGEFVDTRDKKVYKTVTIGSGANAQTWIAQNLNYAPKEEHVDSLGDYAWSGCYNDKADSCAKYGHLYTWVVAMDDAACAYGYTCSHSGMWQGICPNGWHLPSSSEWQTLLASVGGLNKDGTALKTETGWALYNGTFIGTDSYGFSALPAGYRHHDFLDANDLAYFWSSSENESNNTYFAYIMYLHYRSDVATIDDYEKTDALSVRCVQNN